jgi:hypothetical protein
MFEERVIERNGVRVKEFYLPEGAAQPAMSLAEVTLLAGLYPPGEHKYAVNDVCDVSLYVIAGKVDVVVGLTSCIKDAGQAVHIPKGTAYALYALPHSAEHPVKLLHTAVPPFTIEQHRPLRDLPRGTNTETEKGDEA